MSSLKLGILCDTWTTSRLAYLLLGISLGLSACLITLFTWRNATIEDLEIPPWTAELVPSFLIVGGFSAGVLMQRYGRVPVIELATQILGVGWAAIYLSEVVFELFFVGSSLVAWALGMMAPALCVYVIETHPLEANRRCAAGTVILSGILMSSFLLLFTCLKKLVVFLLVITILSYYSLHRNVLDSPIWLMSKKYFEEASSSFKWFGLGLVDNSTDAKVLESRSAALCKDRENARMSPAKMFLYMIFQQVSTNHLLYYYVVKNGISIDIAASMTYVLLGMIPSLVLSEVLDKRTRRRVSLSSTVVVCITYLRASAYEYNFEEGAERRESDDHIFLYTCTLFNCVFGYLCGLYSLPWIIAVENTPSDKRGLLTSVLWLANYLVVRFWLQIYEWIMPSIEVYFISIIFLTMAVVTVLFHLFLWVESLKTKSVLDLEISVSESASARREITSTIV